MFNRLFEREVRAAETSIKDIIIETTYNKVLLKVFETSCRKVAGNIFRMASFFLAFFTMVPCFFSRDVI